MTTLGYRWTGSAGINGNRVLKKHLGHDIRLEHEKYPDVDDVYIYCITCSIAIQRTDIRGNVQFVSSIVD